MCQLCARLDRTKHNTINAQTQVSHDHFFNVVACKQKKHEIQSPQSDSQPETPMPLTSASIRAIAIVGGQGPSPYAAFLDLDNRLHNLQLPAHGDIFRVAINCCATGLVGGDVSNDASGSGNSENVFAALASPSPVLRPSVRPVQPLNQPGGTIFFVAINQRGIGLVGGGDTDTKVSLAALVDRSGKAKSLAIPKQGLIFGVAINNNNVGIAGGNGPRDSAYAALVNVSDGKLTNVRGLPRQGTIYWVASNDHDQFFIGGQDSTTNSFYAAFVSRDGSTQNVGGLPKGTPYSVALNCTGSALIGGQTSDLQAYVARIYTTVTPPSEAASASARVHTSTAAGRTRVVQITGLPSGEGKIYNVTINKRGKGLAVGYIGNRAFAAFIGANNNVAVELQGLPKPRADSKTGANFADGAAIESSGHALVGGTNNGARFLVLVHPSGRVRNIAISAANREGEINSIALSKPNCANLCRLWRGRLQLPLDPLRVDKSALAASS